jgi:hypothetical protein
VYSVKPLGEQVAEGKEREAITLKGAADALIGINRLHHMISMNPNDRRRNQSFVGVDDKTADSFFDAVDTSKINSKARKTKTTKET